MKRLQQLTKEINDLTLKIEQEYPELYKYLDEIPETIPCCNHPEVTTKSFSEYLDSLKQLLEHHIINHNSSKHNK